MGKQVFLEKESVYTFVCRNLFVFHTHNSVSYLINARYFRGFFLHSTRSCTKNTGGTASQFFVRHRVFCGRLPSVLDGTADRSAVGLCQYTQIRRAAS